MKSLIGKKCIVRGDRSGVFYGEVFEKEGTEITLKNARNIYYWDGAARIEELALSGTKSPSNCKFTVIVDEIVLADVIQIIPCTKESIEIIEAVVEWRY